MHTIQACYSLRLRCHYLNVMDVRTKLYDDLGFISFDNLQVLVEIGLRPKAFLVVEKVAPRPDMELDDEVGVRVVREN